jgi:release factor glutamine methyltransferase
MKKVFVKDILSKYIENMSLEYSGNSEIAKRKILEVALHVAGKSNVFDLIDFELKYDESSKVEIILHDILVKKKPIQYAIGSVDFFDCLIELSPPVFIPRTETEYLCLLIVNFLKKNKYEKFRMLDLCTGTGCISISILKHFPKASGVAVDIDNKAILLAKKNVNNNGLDSRLSIIKSNLYEKLLTDKKFDLIVSNPPYIPNTVKLDLSVSNWEDEKALFSGKDGLDCIRRIIFQMPDYISDSGVAILECDSSNVSLSKDLLGKVFGKNNVEIINDQYNIPRFAIMSRVGFF